MQTNNQLIQTKRVWCMTPNKLQQAKLQLNICNSEHADDVVQEVILVVVVITHLNIWTSRKY
jgi:hypothetical protein